MRQLLAGSLQMTGYFSPGIGETTTKAQGIADARSPANTGEIVNLEGMRVRVFGDAPLVTGGVSGKSEYQGRDMSGHYLWTDMFVKGNGR